MTTIQPYSIKGLMAGVSTLGEVEAFLMQARFEPPRQEKIDAENHSAVVTVLSDNFAHSTLTIAGQTVETLAFDFIGGVLARARFGFASQWNSARILATLVDRFGRPLRSGCEWDNGRNRLVFREPVLSLIDKSLFESVRETEHAETATVIEEVAEEEQANRDAFLNDI